MIFAIAPMVLTQFANVFNGTQNLTAQSLIDKPKNLFSTRFNVTTDLSVLVFQFYLSRQGKDGFLVKNNSIKRIIIDNANSNFSQIQQIGQYTSLQQLVLNMSIDGSRNQPLTLNNFIMFTVYIDSTINQSLSDFFLTGYMHTFDQSGKYVDSYMGNSSQSYIFVSNLTYNWYEVSSYFKTDLNYISNSMIIRRIYSNITSFGMRASIGFNISNGTNYTTDWTSFQQIANSRSLITNLQVDRTPLKPIVNQSVQLTQNYYQDKQFLFWTFIRPLVMNSTNFIDIPLITPLMFCLNVTQFMLDNSQLVSSKSNCIPVLVSGLWIVLPLVAFLTYF